MEIQNRPSEISKIPESKPLVARPNTIPETSIPTSQLEQKRADQIVLKGDNPDPHHNPVQLGNSRDSPLSQGQELEDIQSDGLYLNLSGNPSLAWDHLTALTALTTQPHNKTFPVMAEALDPEQKDMHLQVLQNL